MSTLELICIPSQSSDVVTGIIQRKIMCTFIFLLVSFFFGAIKCFFVHCIESYKLMTSDFILLLFLVIEN